MTAPGVTGPRDVASVDPDAAAKTLTIDVDFISGSRFAVAREAGAHPEHDTVSKRYRHLNPFQLEYRLQLPVARVKLPNGAVRQVEPDGPDCSRVLPCCSRR